MQNTKLGCVQLLMALTVEHILTSCSAYKNIRLDHDYWATSVISELKHKSTCAVNAMLLCWNIRALARPTYPPPCRWVWKNRADPFLTGCKKRPCIILGFFYHGWAQGSFVEAEAEVEVERSRQRRGKASMSLTEAKQR